MDGIILTSLKHIYNPKGDIFHAMKKSDNGYDGFGEAYFSTVNQNVIKGWKKHTKMTLNLIVPIGIVEFVFFNEDHYEFKAVKLSLINYKRLTVKPNIWMAFRGCSKYNMLLNLASVEHDPTEVISKNIEAIKYDW